MFCQRPPTHFVDVKHNNYRSNNQLLLKEGALHCPLGPLVRNCTHQEHNMSSTHFCKIERKYFLSFSTFCAFVRTAPFLLFAHLLYAIRDNPARISRPPCMYPNAPTGFLVQVSGTSSDSSFSTLDPPLKTVQKMIKTPNFHSF